MITSKSMTESTNDNLIGFIASTVETIRDEVTTIRGEMVTKTTFEATTTATQPYRFRKSLCLACYRGPAV